MFLVLLKNDIMLQFVTFAYRTQGKITNLTLMF